MFDIPMMSGIKFSQVLTSTVSYNNSAQFSGYDEKLKIISCFFH